VAWLREEQEWIFLQLASQKQERGEKLSMQQSSFEMSGIIYSIVRWYDYQKGRVSGLGWYKASCPPQLKLIKLSTKIRLKIGEYDQIRCQMIKLGVK